MLRRAWPILLAAAFTLAACGSSAAKTSTEAEATPVQQTTAEACPYPDTGFDCDMQHRFAKVEKYTLGRPGTVGIVVRDRKTGAVWRNGHAGDLVWTASTIKLAMTVDLFRRDHEGAITLTKSDRELIKAMLHSSDDNAADTLWTRYSGADHLAFNDAFPSYGLTSLVPQKGYTTTFPYWGFQKCTTDDLDRLMSHVLTDLPKEDHDYIVGELRAVGEEQQWGVWGAGPAAKPGNKDGWSEEDTGWVMNTIGFVGPEERFTLAVMNDLHGQGAYQEGRDTDTEVAKILFEGRF
jgi:hypothetical protein